MFLDQYNTTLIIAMVILVIIHQPVGTLHLWIIGCCHPRPVKSIHSLMDGHHVTVQQRLPQTCRKQERFWKCLSHCQGCQKKETNSSSWGMCFFQKKQVLWCLLYVPPKRWISNVSYNFFVHCQRLQFLLRNMTWRWLRWRFQVTHGSKVRIGQMEIIDLVWWVFSIHLKKILRKSNWIMNPPRFRGDTFQQVFLKTPPRKCRSKFVWRDLLVLKSFTNLLVGGFNRCLKNRLV